MNVCLAAIILSKRLDPMWVYHYAVNGSTHIVTASYLDNGSYVRGDSGTCSSNELLDVAPIF